MGEGTDIVSVPEQRSEQGKAPSTTHEKLVVSDILGKTRDINVFASLTRGFETLSNRLESDSLNATVLAPTNTAIEQLPHKPWENLDDYAKFGANEAYAGKAGEDRATDNLRKFVEAHVIPESPWPEKKEASNLVGQKLYWEKGKDGNIRIHPGDIEVSRIVAQVSNGEVWVLNSVIEYA
ncbi:hypothetical protein PRK78_003878 [Emydomyces testavorans]|uniref:FAS1 domain-containing protein n=1 Tax=Emydomyces testavorans TaxID=2070801 RepID=A0AAF0DH16_9EURO|nr:hypothetical protein PRK78_003878 [Emydomyces testavorans]